MPDYADICDDEMDPLEGLLRSRGRLFVVSGPSGVGKGTVIAGLQKQEHPETYLTRCITATTRKPREGERDGVNYFFFSPKEFERRVQAGYFLEHVTYNDSYYGTPREEVEQLQEQGLDVVLEIEVRGGIAVSKAIPDAVLVFIAPPSWQELERRLRSRRTDSEEHVQRRLAIAHEEMCAAPNYHYVVVNDEIESAVRRLGAIVTAEKCRI